MSDTVAWRVAPFGFVFCLVALVALLVPWLHFVFGPEVSIFDLGAPQLRAAV